MKGNNFLTLNLNPLLKNGLRNRKIRKPASLEQARFLLTKEDGDGYRSKRAFLQKVRKLLTSIYTGGSRIKIKGGINHDVAESILFLTDGLTLTSLNSNFGSEMFKAFKLSKREVASSNRVAASSGVRVAKSDSYEEEKEDREEKKEKREDRKEEKEREEKNEVFPSITNHLLNSKSNIISNRYGKPSASRKVFISSQNPYNHLEDGKADEHAPNAPRFSSNQKSSEQNMFCIDLGSDQKGEGRSPSQVGDKKEKPSKNKLLASVHSEDTFKLSDSFVEEVTSSSSFLENPSEPSCSLFKEPTGENSSLVIEIPERVRKSSPGKFKQSSRRFEEE